MAPKPQKKKAGDAGTATSPGTQDDSGAVAAAVSATPDAEGPYTDVDARQARAKRFDLLAVGGSVRGDGAQAEEDFAAAAIPKEITTEVLRALTEFRRAGRRP